MAQSKKGSRAQQAASASKKKNGTSAKKTTKKSPPKESTRAPKVKTEYEKDIPSTVVTAVVSFVAFLLFLVVAINPDGLLLEAMYKLLLGLIGQVGFYFAIPGWALIFIINTFGRKTNAKLRSICVAAFVFLCGSIYHLAVQTQGIADGIAIFKDLYLGGMGGYTGGVLCGGFAVFLRFVCGNTVSYAILGVAAALTLLGAMQITIPSIIRAINNRPRVDWEEEDEQEEVYIEPAAIVVNHIANRQIEAKRQRRERREQAERDAVEQEQEDYVEVPPAPAAKRTRRLPPVEPAPQPLSAPAARAQAAIEPEPAPIPASVSSPARAARFMNAVEQDIGAPISGGTAAPRRPIRPAAPVIVQMEEQEEIPEKMPDLEPMIPPFVPQQDLTAVFQEKAEPMKPLKRTPVSKPVKQEPVSEPQPEIKPSKPAPAETKPGKVSTKDAQESAIEVAAEIAQNQAAPQEHEYSFPPIDLLKLPGGKASDGIQEMRENSERLNETLASFRIDAHITNVTRGPSVTRYEVELDKGVRLNKLTGCADDIALSLGASGVRIAAVPGKISIVGIEVPNREVTTVSLREVIDSPEFKKSKSHSSFSVGKDIGGSCIVGNISKMPHMLIAGTTGSGKSVCMNSIIISLLYKSGPEDVKLIMVDPKMVELGIYNGIPHLMIPVVTDPKKAAGALQWAVTEMLRRYKQMSDVGVRDLESYNNEIMAEGGQKLPQVIIIIDELADLMLVAAKEVEDSICRIAQMGRAAGMHLIIATQRPSADVITGLMKANIPSRIAFSVASAMESRIILDTQGAEKLVGKGDMLYAPIGIGKPMRVQGCFVTDGEVEAVASYVKKRYEADYDQQVLEEIEKTAAQTGNAKGKPGAAEPDPSAEELEGDEMLPAAVEVILETGQASVSMLQRRLKLGYARAARIVDEMEEKGIVGPFQGSKPRAILVTKEQWAARSGAGAQMTFDEVEDTAVPEDF